MEKKSQGSFTRCSKHANAWQALAQWYQTHLGQKVEARERELLHEVLSNLFGYHLLQMGSIEQLEFLANSRVSRRIVMDVCDSAMEATTCCFRGSTTCHAGEYR